MNSTVLLVLLLVALIAVIRTLGKLNSPLSVADACKAVETGRAVMIDVREANEWGSGVGATARLLPLSDLLGARSQWKPFLAQNGSKLLLLYCTSGIRSGRVATVLRKEGFETQNLGAFADLQREGLPTRELAAGGEKVGYPEI